MATTLPIAAFLASQGLANLGQFSGLSLGPRLTAAPQGSNLALDGAPQAYAGASIVFRPGAPSDDRHAETWAEVEAAITDAGGLITVIVDSSLAQCIVPATADTECFGTVNFSPVSTFVGTGLVIADGGRIRNPGILSTGMTILATPTAVSPILLSIPNSGLMLNGANLRTDVGALVPLVEITASFFIFVMRNGAFVDNSASPGVAAISLAPATQLFWVLLDAINVPVTSSALQGDASTFVFFVHDASVGDLVQPLFLGTLIGVRNDSAANIQPSAGDTASRPTSLVTGQMYFDTDIGYAVWWDGAGWVDATGAPA